MPKTYEPIATNTLGSSAATVTFSSIPATYTDLVIISYPKFSSAGQMITNFNGDTGTNYSITYLIGDGSGPGSNRFSNQGAIGTTPTQINTVEHIVIQHIMNYSNTTTNKTMLQETRQAANAVWELVGLWRNTAAITSVVLTGSSANFAAGSTFTLYGIKAA
jgi:hypothetical protein